MKYNSKKFLALLLSVQMAVSPACVYAQDLDTPVETELVTEAVTEVVTETTTEDVTEAATEAGTEETTEAATETVTEDTTETAETAGETLPEETAEEETEAVTEETAEEVTESLTEIQTENANTGVTLMSDSDEDLTTAVVDNTTTLSDGEYVPTASTFTSVSSGNVNSKFKCTKVTVTDGKAFATISISSSLYTDIRANAQNYQTTISTAEGTSTVEIPMDLNTDYTIHAYTTGMGGKWISYVVNITLEEPETEESEETTATETETEGQTVPDGSYTGTTTVTGKMFNVVASEVTVKDGKATALITLSGTGYDRVYMGTAEAAESDEANWIAPVSEEGVEYTTEEGEVKTGLQFVIPVSAFDTELALAVRSASKGTWADKTVSFAAPEVETEAESEGQTVPDGSYTGTTTVTGKMFNVVASEVTVKDGKVTALITLSGTGYDRVYMGTAEAAESDEANWIAPVSEEGVEYTTEDGEVKTGLQFVIPVSAFDTDLALAVRSASKGTWADKTVNFAAPQTETESESESDTEESTETEDQTVEDGEYTTGKLTTTGTMFSIVASEVTVTDGKATALITLSGTGYDKVYLGTKDAAAVDEENWISSVDATGVEYTNEDGEVKTGLQFVIPVAEFGTAIDLAVRSASKGTWADKTVTFNASDLNAVGGSDEETETDATETETDPVETETNAPEADDSTAAVDNSTTLADGTYAAESFSFSGGSGKTKIYCKFITVEDGKAYATIQFSSSSYDYVKASAGKYYNTTPGSNSTFVIPIALNEDNTIIGNTTAMSTAKEIEYTIHAVLSETAETSDIEESESETEKQTETETEAGEAVDTSKLQNGDYSVTVDDSQAKMFSVVSCVLTYKDGEMTAKITLSGQGYDAIYAGTKEEAANADKSDISLYSVNADGKYEFVIPVAALDTELTYAARSGKTGEWFDRVLVFTSAGMKLIDGTEETEGQTETETETEASTEADKESSYETDLSGGTSAVDSSTTLADGVYTPDKFSWSGGSGRASISCTKITVTNGQAYATIVFNSESYAYLKANGNKYTGTKGGGTTTFVIPVKLNANNTIIGMTTAMSAAHEITYSIYIYLAAADAASSGADGEAPVIAGLTYEDEVELEYADYLRIYNYSDGIKLIEIDMVSDTLRETESEASAEETEALPEEELAAEAAEEAVEDAEASEEEEEVVQTADEIIAELYLEDVVRYLVVPEDVEIPVGLDKEMIIVNVPVESAYIASEEAMLMMEDLDVLDLIAASGFEAEECPCEAVKEALETEEIAFAGTYEELEFKEMVLNRIDIAVLPDEILIKDEETAEEDMERFEQITSGFGTLGIPMIVDRSSDEQTELAQAEWIKAYGILFGCEELADEIYETVVESLK